MLSTALSFRIGRQSRSVCLVLALIIGLAGSLTLNRPPEAARENRKHTLTGEYWHIQADKHWNSRTVPEVERCSLKAMKYLPYTSETIILHSYASAVLEKSDAIRTDCRLLSQLEPFDFKVAEHNCQMYLHVKDYAAAEAEILKAARGDSQTEPEINDRRLEYLANPSNNSSQETKRSDWKNDPLIQARNCLWQGKYAQGLQLCEQSLKRNPQELFAFYWRARISGRQGNWQRAIKDYDYLSKCYPHSATIFTRLAQAFKESGRLTEAEAICQQAVGLDPLNCDARQQLAEIHQSQGHLQEALGDVNECLRQNWIRYDLNLLKGDIYYNRAEYVSALAAYNSAADFDLNRRERILEAMKRKPGEADHWVKRSCPGEAPFQIDPQGRLQELVCESLLMEAADQEKQSKFDQTDYESSLKLYDLAAREMPPSLKTLQGKVLDRRASCKNTLDDIDGAISDYRMCEKLLPEDCDIHSWLCVLLIQKKQYALAQTEYQKSVRFGGTTPGGYVSGSSDALVNELEQYLQKRGKFLIDGYGDIERGFTASMESGAAAALPFYTKEIASHPNNALAYNLRAKAYQDLGDHKAALKDFLAEDRLRPYGKKLGEFGKTLLALCKYDDILKRTGPGLLDEDEYLTRAQAYVALDQKQKAIDDIEEGCRLIPYDHDLHELHGDILVGEHDYLTALAQYNAAMRSNTNPDHPTSRKAAELIAKLAIE